MTASASALSVNALRFAHVSDLHLPFEPALTWSQRFSKRQLSAWSWRRRRAIQKPQILEALRDDIAARAPAQVVVSGDLTNFSLPEEFTRAAQWLEGFGGGCPVHIVPGNHDALVPVAASEGLGRLRRFTGDGADWPWLARRGGASFIGVCSAVPTAPLLASGRIGAAQMARVEQHLVEEGAAGRIRVVVLHHPLVDGAVRARKALRDRRALRDLLRRAGAELVLHGHARHARLDAVEGPAGPIPVLCVPSSSALPNRNDDAARWHLVTLPASGQPRWARVEVRQWSLARHGFVDAASYHLHLPGGSTSP